MEQLEVKQTTVNVSPAILAKAFWSMSDNQQADFFHALGKEVQKSSDAGSFTQMQWYYMADAIKQRSELAKETFLDLSAHAYEFWPQKVTF